MRGRIADVVCVLCLLVACGLSYPVFVEGTSGPLGQDFGQMFLSTLRGQLDALHEGTLLLWDPIRFGGTPHWPLPYTAPAYPLVGNSAPVLLDPRWEPRAAAVMEVDREGLARLRPELLQRFDTVVHLDQEPLPAEAEGRLAALGDCALRCQPEDAAERLAPVWARLTPNLTRLQDPAAQPNTICLELPTDAGGRWLLLAETCSIYPGWSARVGGEPAEILRANAVTSAIALPAGARGVELRYAPPGLWLGLAASGAGLLLGALLLLMRLLRGRAARPRLSSRS
jgi:hypothetical protein